MFSLTQWQFWCWTSWHSMQMEWFHEIQGQFWHLMFFSLLVGSANEVFYCDSGMVTALDVFHAHNGQWSVLLWSKDSFRIWCVSATRRALLMEFCCDSGAVLAFGMFQPFNRQCLQRVFLWLSDNCTVWPFSSIWHSELIEFSYDSVTTVLFDLFHPFDVQG